MKKTLAFIASLVLMTTAFVSCGDKDDDESNGKRSGSSSSVDKSDDKDDKKSSKNDKDDDDSKPSKNSDNDITGTWIPDDAAMEEFFGDMDDDFVLESMTFEFTGNEIILDASMDMSEILCIDGDKFVMYGESIDYDYDGKVISLTYMGETMAEFERVGKADKKSVYGTYSCEEMFGDIEEGEYFLEFPDDNVTYLVMSADMEYSYDEKAGKITITDMYGEVSEMDVEIYGDKMTMTDEEGETVTFERK